MKKAVKATPIKETEKTSGSIVEQVPEPAWLFYVLSFIVPIAGIVVGVIYFSKTDEELKRFGKTCLVIAAIPIALFVLYILALLIFYVFVLLMLIAVYFFIFILIMMLAVIGAFSSASSVFTVGAAVLPAVVA
jgi:hypothetical protein